MIGCRLPLGSVMLSCVSSPMEDLLFIPRLTEESDRSPGWRKPPYPYCSNGTAAQKTPAYLEILKLGRKLRVDRKTDLVHTEPKWVRPDASAFRTHGLSCVA